MRAVPKTLLLACLLAAGGAAALGVEIPVAYESPGDGFLSLALANKQGRIVRSLLSAEPVKGGAGKVLWDGTDDLGRACPSGEYAVRGLFFDKAPTLKYRMTVGRSGNPPYRTPDGKGDWGANLGGGSGIAANQDSVMMVFGCVEDNQITGLQRVDLEGIVLRRYFSFYPWDQRSGAAMDDRNIYVAIYANEKLELAAYQLDESRGKILTALPAKPTATQHGRWRNRPVAYTEGMALSDTTVYVSVPHDDALFLVGRADGKVTRIDLPAPRGLAFHAGKLFAVSGRKLLRLSADGRVETTLVDGGGLEHPSSLAVDSRGDLYVGDSGADISAAGTLVGGDRVAKGGTRQIHVFSAAGKPLRRLGAPGGSPPEGRFKEDGFGEISGIAVDAQGRLWVNDVATGFKRNSLWSADGKLLRQWFCRKVQHTADVVNPANPRELLSIRDVFDDAPPGIYAYEVDFAKGEWKPSWFYELTVERAYAPSAGAYQSFVHGGFPMEKAYPERQGRWPAFNYSDSLVAIDGRLFMLQSSGNGEGAVHRVTPDAPPKPVAMIGYHHLQEKGQEKSSAGEWLANYDQPAPNRWMTWADRNGDGSMQPDEMTITENDPKLAPFRRVYEARFCPDGSVALSLVGPTGFVDATLAPREWLASGGPFFDWSDVKLPTAERTMPDFTGGDGVKKPGMVRAIGSTTKDGVHYALLEPEAPPGLRLPGIDGDGWWASRNWRKKLAAWNPDGSPKWAVGRRAPARAKPGEMYNPMCLSGVARDCIFLSDAMSMTWVWHKDGFYVGRLFADTGMGVMDDTGIYVEMMGNRTHEENGRLYTLVNDTACAVHEVVLPTFKPVVAAAVRLSADDARRAQPWDPDGPDPSLRPKFTAVRHDPTRPGMTPMKLDGEADGREGWHEGKTAPLLILLDGQRLADVRAMYDAKNLYLHYSVLTATPFANAGTELPLSPFVSGAYADFCVGPDWSRPQREKPLAGDVRVILARIGGKQEPFSQAYWPVLPGAGRSPTVIRSPAAEAKFDRIGPVDGLAMAWQDKGFDDRSKLHRTALEVQVPLTALGISGDPAGQSVGFDASVAVANEGGDRRERAMHWAGLSEGVVVDRPGSAVLLPRTWGTLTFTR